MSGADLKACQPPQWSSQASSPAAEPAHMHIPLRPSHILTQYSEQYSAVLSSTLQYSAVHHDSTQQCTLYSAVHHNSTQQCSLYSAVYHQQHSAVYPVLCSTPRQYSAKNPASTTAHVSLVVACLNTCTSSSIAAEELALSVCCFLSTAYRHLQVFKHCGAAVRG
jgi:hypothetical protein